MSLRSVNFNLLIHKNITPWFKNPSKFYKHSEKKFVFLYCKILVINYDDDAVCSLLCPSNLTGIIFFEVFSGVNNYFEDYT